VNEPSEMGRTPAPLLLSARTESALRAQAEQLCASMVAHPEQRSIDVARTLALRTHLPWRAVVVAHTREEMLTGLRALAAERTVPTAVHRFQPPAVVRAQARPANPVFVFPGQGSQWQGMTTDLLRESATFRRQMAECGEALSEYCSWSLRDVLEDGPLDRVDVVQPALFAVMVSLARLWQSLGVQPAAVVGHSQGEIAAAVVAGALSLQDAAKVVCVRSQALRAMSGSGGMASVPLGLAETEQRLPAGVQVAAVNGPSSTVVAGSSQALGRFVAALKEDGVDARAIDVDYASHTDAMEPMRDPLLAKLASIAAAAPPVPFHSTLTGRLLDRPMDARYWFDNIRSRVRFHGAVELLIQAGHSLFIEVSPHPVLAHAIADIAGDRDVTVLGTLRRDGGNIGHFVTAAANAHVSGARVDWSGLLTEGQVIPIPTYPFEGRQYWRPGSGGTRIAGAAAAGHPLLDSEIGLPGGGLLRTGRLSAARHPWLADHVIGGEILLPGTALVEMACSAGSRTGNPQLREMILERPLIVPASEETEVRLLAASDRSVVIESRPAGADEWTRHASGMLANDPQVDTADWGEWPPPGAEPLPVDGWYGRLAERGYGYGQAFRGLRAVWRDGQDLCAEVDTSQAQSGYRVHPALLDAALHALLTSGEGPPEVPFSWKGVSCLPADGSSLRVRLSQDGGTARLTAADSGGRIVFRVSALGLRPLTGNAALAEGLRQVEWQEVRPDPTAVPVKPDPYLVFAGAGNDGPAREAHQAAYAVLDEIRSLPDFADVAVITRNAQQVHSREQLTGLGVATVAGMVRSMRSERPGRLILVDLDDATESRAVLPAAFASGEQELALRNGRLYAPRVVRLSDGKRLTPPAAGPWRLDVTRRGSLADLALVPAPEATRSLGPAEVRIAVHASGLNFRDVAVALKLVAKEREMGSEGAGIVTEVGATVTGLRPGDRVTGVFERAHGPVAIADARMLAPVPSGWSFAQAASVPIVHITVYQCLVEIAALRRGEAVLIHAATGGVGQAALQLARYLGAEVFATAAPAKQRVLRGLGLDDDHIASSRDLEFEERFRGRIDVVLNSLAGETVDSSLRVLRPGGRFVEIGKTDLRDPDEVRAKYPSIRYAAYDLLGVEPGKVGAVLRTVLGLHEDGVLRPLPLQLHDVRRASEALAELRHGRNIGKLALDIPPLTPFPPEGTVLITGGTGALGGLLARHLVRRYGVRRLVLASRRGRAANGARALESELIGLGADVVVAACDAADGDALGALLAAHPPSAVIHAAGVLDDGLAETMSAARLTAVLRPKVYAAWNLHELTSGMNLSAFVLFSSVVGVFGAPGQANYAAANSWLDALAQYRRSRGLPAVSLAWGLWQQRGGMTGHLTDDQVERLRRAGIAPMSTERGLALFDAALQAAEPLLVIANLDARQEREEEDPASRLVRTRTDTAEGSGPRPRAAGDKELLRRADGEEQERVLLTTVCGIVREILGYSALEEVRPDAAFKDLGFDSLLGVDLRNRLNHELGVELPATVVMDNPTPVDLARVVRMALASDE
jgi:acyl transferase domain-containing protein/NADPH:quinone reductase-like Zn-dependent oxidoreductase/acyl carrier protein